MPRYGPQPGLKTLVLLVVVSVVIGSASWAATASPPAKSAKRQGGTPTGKSNGPADATIRAVLTDAPSVPPPVKRSRPAKVIVELEVSEVTLPLSEGVEYTFWTFGGKVPGKFIRVRQGDTVEFHLMNHPDSRFPHNIDLHAVTGPGGGAASSNTAPGRRTQFSFTASNPGLYVYHCATAPVGEHVANGMYGLILVEPPGGLPPVDREYYVLQSDFYTAGKYHEKGHQPFDMTKAVEEHPTYVVFNGAEGALLGEKALKAKVGERVRLFVGNGGPNLVSSFHVIGEIFDRVYAEAGTRYSEHIQTTLVPAGGAAIVEFKVEVPGSYKLVDHSILRAFNKSALGELKVATRRKGRESRERFLRSRNPTMWQARPRVIELVLNGFSGPLQVNGETYNGTMPPMGHLKDEEIAEILSYVRSSWGNSAATVSAAEVAAVRAKTAH